MKNLYTLLKGGSSFLLLLTTSWIATAQSTCNLETLIPTTKKAIIIDYLSEGAGASAIFGFFYLDIDTDKDGTPDFFETGPSDDLDGDGMINSADPDDDNDGILDGADTQPAGVTSMPAAIFQNGAVAAANGATSGDYWQFVPNNTISGGSFNGYLAHPGAYLYIDNNANHVPDILEYATNKVPPYVIDKGVAATHALTGSFLGLLGDWEYSGSPGSTATERTHTTGSTIYYICDDDQGNGQASQYTNFSPYGNAYADTKASTNAQVDYDIYGTTNPASTLIPQQIIGTDAQGEDYFTYRWFDSRHITADRELVYFSAVFWGAGGVSVNTYYSKTVFNPDQVPANPGLNSSTTGDDFGGWAGKNNWFPRFQHTADHDDLAEGVFGTGKTWADIATAPTDGSSPVAVNPADQAWVDKYENWTTDRRIVQYQAVSDWLDNASLDVYAVIQGRYGYDLSADGQSIILRAVEGKMPHFMVVQPVGDPNSLIIGIEDIFGGGDRDYEDNVFYFTGLDEVAISAEKRDSFDAATCSQTIRYTSVIKNSGAATALGVTFTDVPDANSTLSIGSVTTTQGTVTTGNGAGHTSVLVNIGSLGAGDSVKIYFEVTVNNGVYPSTTTISNQGTVSGSNFSNVLTSDLEQADHAQPTATDLDELFGTLTVNCPANQQVAVNNNCEYLLPDYTSLASSPDFCTSFSASQSPNDGTTQSGITTITLTGTDGLGRSNTCTFDVTPTDGIAPTINCPATVFANNEVGNCSAVVTYTPPTGTDNCTGATTALTAGQGDGGIFPVGNNTETYTVTDAAGNTASCSFTVTVSDTEAPKITCPATVFANNDPGVCEAVVSYTPPSGTDNCPGQTTALTAGQGDGGIFPVGNSTETYTVTDAAGNTASCSFTVTVSDTEAPKITCPATVFANNTPGTCEGVATYIPPAGTDNCPGQATALTAGQGDGGTFPVGNSTETYTVTDAAGNTASCSFTVTVKDVESPTFNCPTSNVVRNTSPTVCSHLAVGSDLDPLVTDNCQVQSFINDFNNANSLDGASLPKGKTLVTWTATDVAGNSATCAYNIRIRDREGPVFDNCPPSATYLVPFCTTGHVHTWPTITATDNCTNPNKITFSPTLLSGSFFPLGTTYLHITATDKAGNTSDCDFSITVTEDCDPLPAGMDNEDIGNTGNVVGKTCYDATTGTFEIKTSGSGIGSNADGFHLISRESSSLTMDIIAHIVAHPTNNHQDHIGVMIRQTNANNAASVATLIAGDNKTLMVNRALGGLFSTGINGPTLPGPLWPGPSYWMRLQRVGTAFTASISPDGATWTIIGTMTAVITGTYEVGIAASAGTPGQVVHYTVDQLSISTGGAPRLGRDAINRVSTFPNPVRDELRFRVDGLEGDASIRLIDGTGRVVLFAGRDAMNRVSTTTIEGTFDVREIAAGVYLLEITTQNERQLVKVVKR